MKVVLIFFLLFPIVLFSQQSNKPISVFTSKSQEIIRNNFVKDMIVIHPKKAKKQHREYALISDYFTTGSASQEKVAKVLGHSGWGLINETGKEVLSTSYQQIHDFKRGIVRVTFLHPNERNKLRMDARDSYINFRGKFLTPKFNTDNEIPSSLWSYYESFPESDLYVLKGENGFSGVFDKDLNTIIPSQYKYFEKGYNLIIASNNLYSGKRKEFDIYNHQGKFLKKLTYHSLTNFKNLLIATDESGSFFLDTLSFLPKNEFKFDFYHDITDSKIAILKVFQIIDKANTSRYRENTRSYFVDQNLKIINADFHTAELYEDKFLIQHDHNQNFGHRQQNIKIISLEGKLMAEYSIADFQLYHYFYPEKLTDKAYLETRKQEWQNYTLVDTSITNPQKYHDFRMAYTKDEAGNADKMGIFDIKTGNLLFLLDAKVYSRIHPLSDRKHFAAYAKDEITLTDAKGTFLKKLKSENVYNYTKDILISANNGKNSFLDSKTLKDLYEKTFSKPYETHEQKNYILVYDGKTYGFINLKTKKLKMTNYPYYSTQNSNIVLYNSNSVEIYEKENAETVQKIQFKNNYFTTKEIGGYLNGIFTFSDYNFAVDQYGNIIDLHQTSVSFY